MYCVHTHLKRDDFDASSTWDIYDMQSSLSRHCNHLGWSSLKFGIYSGLALLISTWYKRGRFHEILLDFAQLISPKGTAVAFRLSSNWPDYHSGHWWYCELWDMFHVIWPIIRAELKLVESSQWMLVGLVIYSIKSSVRNLSSLNTYRWCITRHL